MLSSDPKEITIFDFNRPASTDVWRIVNDGVMGGLSSSQLKWQEDGTAVFSGDVSLDNNGGFASVRTVPQPFDLIKKQGILLRVKGDGKTYKFRIRTDAYFDGVAYSLSFTTRRGEWTTIELPFRDFLPTFRGRVLKNIEPIESEKIHQLGFLIADKQVGHFSMEIDWIKAY